MPRIAQAGEADAPNVVSLEHVTLRYDDDSEQTVALDDVTLSVREGERVCVLGANGSGKSTLASVICGLLAPDEGTVTLVGERVFDERGADFGAYRRARREVGLVFQNPDDQIVTSVVEEDVAFGPENLRLPPDEIGLRVERELRRVALADYAHADPSRLSGGQKQRVAIAGALAMSPRVLVLDEPGALLDVRGRRGIMRVMDQLHDEGTTVIHITHFMEEALAADRVLVMDRGHVALQGTPFEVFARGEEIAALGLEEPFVARLSTGLRTHGLDVPWTCDKAELHAALQGLVRKAPEDVGDVGACRQDTREAPQGDIPAVSAEHVWYSYHDSETRWALRDVSLAVPRGTSVALVGQTGSGKSTLVRLLCALEVPDRGTIGVDGLDTSDRRQRRLLHGRIGYVMQHPERQLFAETVWDDVAYGPRNLGLSPTEVDDHCRRALAVVGLGGREGLSPFKLSGGQQRLCALAGILAMEPRTLVLDEPMAGLDPRGRTQLEAILTGLASRGMTTIRVTHSMEDAARADWVVVLSQAQVLAEGKPGEVFCAKNESLLHDAGLGLPEPLRWALDLGVGGAPLTLEDLVEGICARMPDEARLTGEGDRHGL